MATQQIDEYYESLAYWKQQAQDYEQALRDIKYNTIMNMSAEIEQLKAELKESNDSWQRERLSAANYQVIEQLKSENNRLNKLAEGILAREESISAELKLRIEIESENAALKSKLEKAKKGLEFYADGEGDVLDWSGVNNSAYIQVKGKRAKQTLLEIGDTE